jgi:hypothetical protein
MLIKTYFSDNIGEFFYAGFYQCFFTSLEKKKMIAFYYGHQSILSLCVTEGSFQRFDDVWAESANQMYHWSRTICSYKTDIEESWVPSCPILICVAEKTQWVILCQFHPTGWETLLHCPWISKIYLSTQKTGTLCIWLLCIRSEKTPWQTLEGETKVTQWTCSWVQS